ncbi:MAG TPA: DUF1080 domain-containing protein [Cyclobacteriaceae bacterium]
MKYPKTYLVLPVVLLLYSNFQTANDAKWRSLFNGKDFTGWDTYVGPAYDKAQDKFAGDPLGLNNDPNHIFSVIKEDGKSAIRISGEQFGGISTREEFKNYHLRLEFKWGTLKWEPKKDKKRDSGILYHAVGAHGADGGFWMRSQEFQIQEGDCGDYWGVAGGAFDVRAMPRKEKEYVYDAAGPLLTFSEKSQFSRQCIKSKDAEKPTGQWNIIDIYCFGSTSVHMVNGVVVMALYNSRQETEDDELPLTKGKIQIQSEGAEVFYSNIQIQPIQKLPENLISSSR